MVHKSIAKSVLSAAIAATAILGIIYSCSSADSSAQKNASTGKDAAASLQSSAKGTDIKASGAVKEGAVSPEENRQLVVYYFMTSTRCQSCHFIEETTRAAIDENFAEQIKSGRIIFKMLNIEEPQNAHFENDYKLYTKSVILSDLNAGKETRWTNLEKVWQLIGNQQGFKEYIVKEVNAYLGA